MKKRTAIYCYYSPKEIIYKETYRQIMDLRNNVDNLIVVINGGVDNSDILSIADKLLVRPNEGLDAGAYKCALMQEDIYRIVKESDELILCNNTFYGPFCGFEDIFNEMDRRNVDFWGMNYFDNGILKYIQSYFLVFEKSIIIDNDFFNFFKEKINEKCNDWASTCYWFENALYNFLNSKYKHECYSGCVKYSVYENPDKCILEGLPILKKKVFSKYYDRDKIFSSLKIVKQKYQFSLQNMVDEVMCEYGININLEEIDEYIFPNEVCVETYPQSSVDIIHMDIPSDKKIYIYGTGVYAYALFYKMISNYCIQGFIVSEEKYRNELCFLDKPVYLLDEIEDKRNAYVIVAASKRISDILIENLYGFEHIFTLWK